MPHLVVAGYACGPPGHCKPCLQGAALGGAGAVGLEGRGGGPGRGPPRVTLDPTKVTQSGRVRITPHPAVGDGEEEGIGYG
jgi:hypothetical protein